MRKNIFITGCSSGIGRALALAFHKLGCRVIATARRLDSITDLQDMGMATFCLDVTDKGQSKNVVETVLTNEKRIDVLINNAGYALIGPSIELPSQELSMQFETNVMAPLFLAKLVAPSMKQNGHGVIVNIGSISGITTTPFSGAYCASKAALHALSDALRMELSAFGIHVVTVQPGSIQSDFGNAAYKTISRVLGSNSWYIPVKKSIEARAGVSQDNATPTDEFAQKVVAEIMSENPKPILRIGKMSRMLPLMKKFIPTSMLDGILKGKFGLSKDSGLG